MATTTIATINVHQSKWGYHPCSREQFLYLKKAHKLFLRAYRDTKRWITWSNKTVYRYDEPVKPELFVEHGHHLAGKKAWYGLGFKKFNGKNLYHLVLEAYQNARKPVSSPNDVKTIDLPENFDKLVNWLETFYSSQS